MFLIVNMVIEKGVHFLFQAGLSMGTAQLAVKKNTFFFQKIIKRVHLYDFDTILISHIINKHFLEKKNKLLKNKFYIHFHIVPT